MHYLIKIITIVMVLFLEQITFCYVPMQVQNFKKAAAEQKSGINCARCDFRGAQELVGVIAPGVFMPGVTFQPCVPTADNKNMMMVCVADQKANLKKVNFSGANLFASCFDQAILDNADLSNVNLSHSSVQHASLKGAKVGGIITENATFCNSIMPDGSVCKETWKGQGVVIACNCTESK